MQDEYMAYFSSGKTKLSNGPWDHEPQHRRKHIRNFTMWDYFNYNENASMA